MNKRDREEREPESRRAQKDSSLGVEMTDASKNHKEQVSVVCEEHLGKVIKRETSVRGLSEVSGTKRLSSSLENSAEGIPISSSDVRCRIKKRNSSESSSGSYDEDTRVKRRRSFSQRLVKYDMTSNLEKMKIRANSSESEFTDARQLNSNTVKHVKKTTARAKRNGLSSKFRGVCRNRRKWQAVIWVRGTRQYLGTFVSEEDAARAYDEAALEFRGVKAVLNFPSSNSKKKKWDTVTSVPSKRMPIKKPPKTRKKKTNHIRSTSARCNGDSRTPASHSAFLSSSLYTLDCPSTDGFSPVNITPFITDEDILQAYNAAAVLNSIMHGCRV